MGGLLVLLIGLDQAFPLPLQPDYSPVVLAADGRTVLHATLNRAQQWRMYARLAEVSPLLQRAIVAKEDRWFWRHPGVNPAAVARAAWANLTGTRTRPLGASTITMQVARLLQPKSRTLGHKLLEALRAGQLEWHLSKAEILELYLNRVPYGGNIEGVRAAALLYFQQPPGRLTLAQAAALAVIPNDPVGLAPGRGGRRLLVARDAWLHRFYTAGLADYAALADALRVPLPTSRTPVPRRAPHLARRLLRASGGQPVVTSTLDPGLQATAEYLTANYVRRLAGLGIPQAAVLVVENRTRAVRAYVGSADFHDIGARGQVDGLTAVRSPGSTLKPLLYALAFDEPRGLTPASVVLDVPTDFGRGYRPQNFDQTWHGAVAVQEALALSLNGPAVRVLNERVGVPRFVETLGRAGFRQVRRDTKRLGLSAVLGGCGVRATELAGLYCALANGGWWAPLVVTSNELRAANDQSRSQQLGPRPTPLVTPEAAWLTTEILRTLRRPDLPHEAETSRNLPRVAWKTGTSYGRRDAWSVGYNPRYTICVWVGDFTGRGIPALTGTDIGTPLLFDLFDALDHGGRAGWFSRPESLDLRDVCTETGLVPDSTCRSVGRAWYRPGVSEAQVCAHQRLVWLDPAGRFSYCPACLPAGAESSAARAKATRWPNPPPELAAWRATQGLPGRVPPPHNPACPVLIGGAEAGTRTSRADPRAPRILAPALHAEISFDPEDPNAQILLRAAPDPSARRVYWYLNNQFLRAAAPTERVFCRPPRGWVKLSCADDQGRHTDQWVRIE
ncbi:MAG: penicillin-binding protein 1C [Hymenobacteraceae bacterium]|nr:penicillin-binding protein 1C [Hymenobacteraceae bacterium]